MSDLELAADEILARVAELAKDEERQEEQLQLARRAERVARKTLDDTRLMIDALCGAANSLWPTGNRQGNDRCKQVEYRGRRVEPVAEMEP